MIFKNSPWEMVDQAFKNLFPEKKYIAYLDTDMVDETDGKVCGFTFFPDNGDTPMIFIDFSVSIVHSVEVFAHELAHIAVGSDAEHTEKWEKAFTDILIEYNRIGAEKWGKQAETKGNAVSANFPQS